MLKKLAQVSGAKVWNEAKWPSAHVTHVVCHVNENRRAKRTIKYLMGIANVRGEAHMGVG